MGERFFAIARDEHFVALAREARLEHAHVRGRIVRHQNAGGVSQARRSILAALPMRLDRTDPLAAFLLRSPLGAVVDWAARIRASVQRKLLVAFLLITLLFMAMGAFSVLTMREMSRRSELLDRAHLRLEWSQ